MSKNVHYQTVIVGGGTGGITVAAQMLRNSKAFKNQIAIIDPSEKHYYQPLWTLVGAGVVKKEVTERNEASVIPEGATWIKDSVAEFHPEENYVVISDGSTVSYDYLVVAAGIQLDWDGIKSLKGNVGSHGICSNYSFETVDSTWENIRNFKGGTALFTYPNTPIKCGGAPQKIMYLAEEYFQKAGVRDKTEVVFASASPSIFGVPKYRATLEKVIQRKNIQTKFRRNLVEVRPATKEAVFENLDTQEQEIVAYDMLHVVPPMSAPNFIKNSPLADSAGWLEVDKYTLQHPRFTNVFGLGDCTSLPASRTGAAIRKQAPVVVQNLLSVMRGKPLSKQYDGYSSCPLVTGYGSLILAEFDYDNNPSETFPFDQAQERYSMYLLKKEMLPVIYWNGMLKGTM